MCLVEQIDVKVCNSHININNLDSVGLINKIETN